MQKYWALDAAHAVSAGWPSIAMVRKDDGTIGNESGTRRCAMALAVCLAMGLSACGGGGGGGSNVKGPPPPPSGGGMPEETNVNVFSEITLTVKNGESVNKPIIMWGWSNLDNAGSIGGSGIEVAVSSSQESLGGVSEISNHDGGTIEGGRYAFYLSSASIANSGAGSVLRGGDVGVNVFSLTLRNSNGALVTGGEVGVGVLDGRITNTDGGTIRGGRVAIRVADSATIYNGAGSTIETTGTSPGDCNTGGSCAIQAYPDKGRFFTLENAGSIIGNVQLDPTGHNKVILWAGGSIHGDLLIDRADNPAPLSSLVLNGGAGTTQRYSQAVTGTTTYHGTWSKEGEGTWVLDSLAAAQADFWIRGGTLQIGDGGTEGSTEIGDVDIAIADGRLLFNRSDDVVFDANISGGILEHAGAGLLTLATFGKKFSALIRNGAGRRMQIGIVDGGMSCCSVLASSIVNDGALTFGGSYDVWIRGGISGAGSMIQDGAGRTVIFEENAYSGATTVNKGTLQALKGLPGDVTVRSSGVLGGAFQEGSSRLPVNGLPRVAGNVSNDGRVAADRGNMQVGGDYRQSTTGTLAVRLGSKLDVAGTATLEGGALEVIGAEDGYVGNTRTEVLTASNGVVGTFDRLVKGPGVVFTSSTIHYDPNNVWLDTTGLNITIAAAGDGVGYTPASMNSAERVQGAFEQLNDRIATDTLAGVPGDFLHAAGQFQRAPSIEAAQASLRSLSGQLHAASATMAFRAIDAGNQALSDHLDELRDGHTGFGMWTQQLGSGGGMARNGFDGVGFQLDGWLVGNDYRIGSSGVAGFAFGQGMGRQQLQNGFDRDDSRRTEGMFYAGLAGDRWYSQGRLGFGHVRQDVSRRLLLGDAAEGVWTRYDGRYQVAYGESGLRFGRGDMRLTPFVSVEYARSDRDGFAEQGAGGFGLRSDAQALERWQTSVGVRAARRWNFGNGRTLDFGAHAQWRRTLGANGDDLDASFVGLQQWSPLLGIGLSRYGGLFGVGLDARLSPRATLKFAYDYENGQYESAQRMSAGLTLAF